MNAVRQEGLESLAAAVTERDTALTAAVAEREKALAVALSERDKAIEEAREANASAASAVDSVEASSAMLTTSLEKATKDVALCEEKFHAASIRLGSSLSLSPLTFPFYPKPHPSPSLTL